MFTKERTLNYYFDVFIPGGIPTITYNPRSSRRLEDKVRQAKRNINKLMVITGPTKTGKTVLVEKVFARDEAVWVDGGAISNSEDSFWEYIVSTLAIPVEYGSQKDKNSSVKFTIGAEGHLKIPVVC